MSAQPGTTIFGYLVREQICQLVKKAAPDVTIVARTAPGMKGVALEEPPNQTSTSGFRYAEVKPRTKYGARSFDCQVARLKLPAPVQAISFNYTGDIYYGFKGVE